MTYIIPIIVFALLVMFRLFKKKTTRVCPTCLGGGTSSVQDSFYGHMDTCPTCGGTGDT